LEFETVYDGVCSAISRIGGAPQIENHQTTVAETHKPGLFQPSERLVDALTGEPDEMRPVPLVKPAAYCRFPDKEAD
jgi:hypothetical protein